SSWYDPAAPASIADMDSIGSQALAPSGFPRVLSFHLVGPGALVAELLIGVITSVAAGVGYHLLVWDAVGPVDIFFGIGLVAFTNFCAISAARGNYQPRNLINFRKQLREVVLAWGLVCLLLLGVAFSLKISDTFSRGATIG